MDEHAHENPSAEASRRKRDLRRRLRSARTERYGGEAGAERRREEAERLAAHAAPLLALVDELVAASRAAGDDSPAPRVSAYHPTPTEADAMPLARLLAEHGAELVFPAASSGEQLDWVLWDGSSEFLPSPGRGFGREPEGPRLGTEALTTVALVLAPALAVDLGGTRIGHGAGYYDRALTTIPNEARVVAVVHPTELLEAGTLPREEHDVPIPEVLTAEGLVSLVTSTRP